MLSVVLQTGDRIALSYHTITNLVSRTMNNIITLLGIDHDTMCGASDDLEQALLTVMVLP